jgi:hypothetical protein
MTILTDIAAASTAANEIDPAFPVAGQDNNSQGFRDNFNNTQIGLQNLVDVVTALNTNTAKLDAVSNDFNGTLLENASIKNLYGTVSSTSVGTADSLSTVIVNVDSSTEDYFRYNLLSDVNLRLSNWPDSDFYRKVRFEIRADDARDLTFSTTGGTDLYIQDGMTMPFGISTGKRYIFDVWTVRDGNEVFVQLVSEFVLA